MGIFNSNQFAWRNITATILGKTVTELTEVSYDVDRDTEYVFAAGDEPQGIQRGNKKYNVKIGLLQSGIELLEEAARLANPGNPSADITDIEFDINVTYADGLIIKTDRIKNFACSKYGKGGKQGDKNMPSTLDGMALGIERNV